MKTDLSDIEQFRVGSGQFATNPGDTEGMFILRDGRRQIRIIFSSALGWEHASVTISYRNNEGRTSLVMPSWDDMCRVKDLFWSEDETVVQFHPAKSDYVNRHDKCLHLWRPTDAALPPPLTIMV